MNVTLRRREFAGTDLAEAEEVLSGARYGQLATLDEEGMPEVRPMNFVVREGALYFHCSPHTGLARRGPASFCCVVDESWIPSYWRDRELACPATTFYRSLVVRGHLQAVAEAGLKADLLAAFMRKYQPEGGYRPLTSTVAAPSSTATPEAVEARYRKPLEGLTVLRLPVERWSLKVKMGQHLSSGKRQDVYRALLERGDVPCARAMRRANPDLRAPLTDGFCDDPARLDPQGVWELLRNTYWAHKRNPELVASNLTRAHLNLGFMSGGELLAYCRVGLLQPDTGWLFDVVVREDQRGSGLGTRLMGELLAHPRVRSLGRLLLDTRDAMSFYGRFGWRELDRREGRSLMLRPAPGKA